MGTCASSVSQPKPPKPTLSPLESKDIWFEDDPAPATPATTDQAPPSTSRRRRLSVSTVDSSVVDRPKHTDIVKRKNPVADLVDRTGKGLREVSLGMLRELFPAAEHYCVFGSPSYSIQRGFDNKVVEVGGGMPPGKCLKDIGIGYACKKGLKPESPNQDDYFILRVDDWSMYGVFDGHGPDGHEISAFVHKTLPFLIISDPEFETNIQNVLMRAFTTVHELVVSDYHNGRFDASLSGTTATVIVERGKTLTVAHVGDSRAVVALREPGGLAAVDLSRDHKPTLPDELARIEACGGEVRKFGGDIPHRVFARGRVFPGLAMSRAIGDAIGARVGVSCEPEITTFTQTPTGGWTSSNGWSADAGLAFICLATDGVWEFISSQESVDLLAAYAPADVDQAAEALAYESWRRWVEEEEHVVDDVTCIVIWAGNDF